MSSNRGYKKHKLWKQMHLGLKSRSALYAPFDIKQIPLTIFCPYV